jgi:transitional endoplasmic reticulum ATPase
VLFEDLDVLLPKADCPPELLHSFFTQLRSLFSRAKSEKLALIATTRDPKKIEPQIRQLFEEELQFGVPLPPQRLEMLRAGTARLDLHPSVDLVAINLRCHAFLFADMLALIRDAVARSLSQGSSTAVNSSTASTVSYVVEPRHFVESLKISRVGSVQGNTSVQQIERVLWEDIGGLEDVKEKLEESVIWAFRHADAFRRLNVTPSKGVLLYGPPGTGKTMLAKAVATASSANFLPVSIPDLLKGEVGETEKAIQKMFSAASLAAPCVVFLDEIEALFGSRGSATKLGQKMVSQLLIEMDSLDGKKGAASQVVVLAATNVPWVIDPAILRPGRLDTPIYVPPPNEDARAKILRLGTFEMPLAGDVDFATLAKMTPSFTGADIKNLCRNAALVCLQRQLDTGEEVLRLFFLS